MVHRREVLVLLLCAGWCCCVASLSMGSSSLPPYGIPEPRVSREELRQAYERYSTEQHAGKTKMGGGKEEEDEESRHRIGGKHDVYHGTTTCSFVFDGGILVAVDSRASMGSYIGTGAAEKVIPVSSKILGTMAGGAADCSFWLRHLAMQVRLKEMEGEDGEGEMTVARASKILANRLTRYLGKLSVGTMVMGHDSLEGFSVYYVDNEGVRTRGNMFAVGSGSTYAYSILDSGYRWNMTVEEAKTLGLRAIRHATYRDAFSGGLINVYLITKEGWRRIARVDSGLLNMDGTPATADGQEQEASSKEGEEEDDEEEEKEEP